ncbi:GNAT family N-acetyltransferase [Domibacillus iocasae]|uniref:N-acetyltransferase domain-containing protein n=1 Tax=Domibacillus iocasae TaxID=1714016 RepID=A0A1E7DPK0_9BACI|nr:GNAT family N-acetyltransferase [Domibacillus iocasae]OES44984.1 hypothetical protein BA724_06890 [Domibacillus iocasae]
MVENGVISIIPVRPSDVELVSKWTEEWIVAGNSSAYSLTIFSSPGYTNFLTYQQSIPWPYNPTRLLGAYDEDALLGFIEIRIMSDRLFINNFCVQKEARGRRVGEMLLQQTELLARSMNKKAVSLDCFLWNERAMDKYLKAGFHQVAHAHWFTSENQYRSEKDPALFLVEGYPNAEANQKEFGFSQFQIRTENGIFSVNRLKENYFRVTANEQNLNYFNILSRLDQNRSLFIISPDSEPEAGSLWKKVSSSVRMEKLI